MSNSINPKTDWSAIAEIAGVDRMNKTAGKPAVGRSVDNEIKIEQEVTEVEKTVRYVKGSLDAFKLRKVSSQNFIGGHRAVAASVASTIEMSQAEKDAAKANQGEKTDDNTAYENAKNLVNNVDESIQHSKQTLTLKKSHSNELSGTGSNKLTPG